MHCRAGRSSSSLFPLLVKLVCTLIVLFIFLSVFFDFGITIVIKLFAIVI